MSSEALNSWKYVTGNGSRGGRGGGETRREVDLLSIVPSLTSTERVSVPYSSCRMRESCYSGEPVWHRHSCLCWCKVQCLMFITTLALPPTPRATPASGR